MKISVAMCTYNGEEFLNEQIDSILNQSMQVNEIVVCDDGSTDKTIKILNEYLALNPDLFKIYINEVNLRSVKNFEKAINLCTGDIIFLSDQDDIWVKEKVESYMEYFIKNPRINVLASNGYCLDHLSEVKEKYAIWDVPAFLRAENINVNYYNLITQIGNLATGASMAFRKEILNEVLPFPIIKDFHHDEWIAIISSKKNSFELLDEKYFYYRIHKNQQVGGVFYKKNEITRKSLTHLFDLYESDSSLVILKRRLKKLAFSYQRNLDLLERTESNSEIFEGNLETIENTYNKISNFMMKKYPLTASILKVTDKLLNKRQLSNKK